MPEPKDTTTFFQKVVKFVANPATDWADLSVPTQGALESEYAKSELKAMVDRKRRNDFVRKREFDMLRRVRREGLNSEQLAALGVSSRLDDSEARMTDSVARSDSDVKAKIDEIEQQMVGDSGGRANLRRSGFDSATTQAAAMRVQTTQAVPQDLSAGGGRQDGNKLSAPQKRSVESTLPVDATPASGLAPLSLDATSPSLANAFTVDVSDVLAHDPELDEAVIAFANAGFDLCEQSLVRLTGASGERAQHADTWLALFDLYRATGQSHKFESLAIDYAQQFGWSAPQWYSLPKMVAEAAGSDERPERARIDGQVGWACPQVLDVEVVAHLSSQTLQMPLPWVFDWSALQRVDAEACARLSDLFRGWIPQAIEMSWLSGDRLLVVLQEAAPTGVRDADPIYWQLRLDALRMVNRADRFDEAAIDYCLTYEVSPPSWEPSKCQVRIGGGHQGTTSPSASSISEPPTGFMESQIVEDPDHGLTVSVDLAGQLVGDISNTLKKMDHELGKANVINVSCVRLIRVDFIAAGDLLNWVLAQRNKNRSVCFTDAHRLVALFFGAMGINEHAKVKVRTL